MAEVITSAPSPSNEAVMAVKSPSATPVAEATATPRPLLSA
jgi:hypothetical protein